MKTMYRSTASIMTTGLGCWGERNGEYYEGRFRTVLNRDF